MTEVAGSRAHATEATAPVLSRNIPIICGALGLAVGAIVLLGWALRVDALTRVLPGLVAMNPATAVALMSAGLSLSVSHLRIALARGAALAVVAVGGLKLAQLIGVFPWGVDQILFPAWIEIGAVPSRMAPSTAGALFLLGCSILSNTFESKRALMGTQIAAGGASVISLFTLVGYVLGLASLYGGRPFIPMALHTAITILILSIGNLSKRSMELIAVISDRGPAGSLARLALPLSVLIPVGINLIRLEAQRAGFYDPAVVDSLAVVGNVVGEFGLLLGSVIVLHRSDIARRRREVAVARSEAQYRLAETVANAGHWHMDVSSRRVSWSDEIFNIVGIAKDQGVPDPAGILNLYHSEDRAGARMSLIHALKTGEGWSFVTRLVRPNGEVRSVISQGVCEQRADGHVTAVFGVFADVTEREKALHAQVLAQEKLQSVQAEMIHLSRVNAMGAMASTLAHELNQPLTVLMGYAESLELMAERGVQPAEFREPLSEIGKGAARAADIIRSLREMTRKGESAKEQFLPSDIIKEAGALASVGACEGINLEYDFQTDLAVMGDPIQIQQVLINLIRNACQAVTDHSDRNVLVVCNRCGGDAVIWVQDDGPGISNDQLRTLFDAFVTTKEDGMGLGLSISRTIVEAHGGKIWAENRTEGGARFSFTVPLAEPLSG